MSYADYLFVHNCRKILSSGISDEKFDVRPKWSDGTPAHTKKILYITDRYDLSDGSIPVMTLRKTGFKNAIDEILWIYQKKTSDISKLRSHIWDAWNVGDGTIGTAYGYQIGKVYDHHKCDDNFIVDNETYPSMRIREVENPDGTIGKMVCMDQMDSVLWDLKNNDGSRSIRTDTYNFSELTTMGLRPCAHGMNYNVTIDKDGNKILNAMLIQRSQDMLTANNWNVVQYSVLVHMLAQVCNMKPGTFVHCVSDMHIYDRHIPIVQEIVDKYSMPELATAVYPHPNPKFWINPEVKNFYDFTLDDFKLIDYEYDPFNYKIPVAE